MKKQESKDFIIKMVRRGLDKDTIKELILKDSSDNMLVDSSFVSNMVDQVCEDYPDYNLIQKIMRSKLIRPINSKERDVVLLDLVKRNTLTIDERVLSKVLDPKVDLSERMYTCELEYNPFSTQFLFLDPSEDNWVYNTYEPPFWQREYFYTKGKKSIKKADLPELYDRFFKHLVNGKEESYEYLLNWLANAVQERNYCILATIGAQGIGKGVLGEIMRVLFGRTNFYQGSDRMFSGQFNSQIADKKLVYCDEISIKNVKEEDRLKMVVNDFIEIEKKGIDALEKRNYANFYVSSNNLDSIKLSGDDRRFSILDLTDTKLKDTFSIEEIQSLLDESNVGCLAQYLTYREVNKKAMLVPYKSVRAEEVRSASLNEWQEYFLEEICEKNVGKTLILKEVVEDLDDKFLFSRKPGRGAFKKLQDIYPERFIVKKESTGERQWVIKVL